LKVNIEHDFELLHFLDDGLCPNNQLPVIVYYQVTNEKNKSDWLEKTFKQNGWTNNWRDVVLGYDHFHSNTHEVLGIGNGKIKLQLGGRNGKSLKVSAGDVIILPAGVGHYAIEQNEKYEIVGGYPDGKSWDMCTGHEEDRNLILSRIKDLAIPAFDPVFGLGGQLSGIWRQCKS